MTNEDKNAIGAAWAAARLATVYLEAKRMGDRDAMATCRGVMGWFNISEQEWQQAIDKIEGGA